MPVTREQIVDILLPEEPDFRAASSTVGPSPARPLGADFRRRHSSGG